MNRTRRLVAAGLGAAVIVVIVAMVLLAPNLHTQTPASTAPPSNGGTGGGGSGGTGTGGGTGSGNGTLARCNVTEDDGNDTSASSLVVTPLGDGNRTNETGDQDGGACGATVGDHDSMGDQESAAHRAAQADHGWADELSADVLALVPGLASAYAAAGNALASVGRPLAGFLGGLAPSLAVFVTGR